MDTSTLKLKPSFDHTWSASKKESISVGMPNSVSLSSMWSKASNFIAIGAMRILKNKRHIDSLLKVVDPAVKHSLSFGEKDQHDNYTDMRKNSIVIDGDLISEDDTNLDILAGLGIHEKLRCIHSHDLVKWQNRVRSDLCSTDSQLQLFQSISNIIEAEYIEMQLAKTCVGYVHYLEKTKDYFFTKEYHSLTESTDKYADVINTLLMLVRYPSMIDNDRKKKHAQHIIFFGTLTKDIDSRDKTYKAIEACYRYLLKLADKMSEGKSSEDILEEATSNVDKRIAQWDEDGILMVGADKDRMRETMLKDELVMVKRREMNKETIEIDSVVDMLTGKCENGSEEKGLDADINSAIRDLEDSDFSETEMPKSLVYKGAKQIEWRRSISNEIAKEEYTHDKDRVKIQINKLKKKIDLYGNTQKLTIRNQKRGRLDKRLLHKIPMGMTDLFRADIVNEDKPLDICLLVDESGSMDGHTMRSARQSAIALKEALTDNSKINLWVYGHTADQAYGKETNMTEYWSPTMKDRPFAMSGMKAKAENRDGNAIIASAERVASETDNNGQKLMIVMSDGEPSADGYRGWDAIDHTAKCVKHVETKGWNIIQVGFDGCEEEMMEKQFTNYIRVDDTDKLGDSLSKIIRKVVRI